MKFKVLIIDDDEIILVLHKVRVRKLGLDEDPACLVNGIEALEYIKKHDDPTMHFLLLLDINMPKMNGWELLQAINQFPHQSKISVALVTSSVDKHDKELAQAEKLVFGFFEKPLEVNILEDMMNLLNSKEK
jgi:CheY-like chemotaxis protein